jgi:hypothetical protein
MLNLRLSLPKKQQRYLNQNPNRRIRIGVVGFLLHSVGGREFLRSVLLALVIPLAPVPGLFVEGVDSS